MKKVAVITGVAGQDGSHLAELLLEKDFKVIGISRRKSVEPGMINISEVLNNKNFILKEGDIIDSTFMSGILYDYKPHLFFNLAAQSNVGHSFKEPIFTFKVNAEAVMLQLELIRQISPYTRYYSATTSEMFGGLDCPKTGYNESSPFNPRSPYAVAKVAAFYAVKNYRDAYGLHASSGVLHNHSSKRRGHDFATRKITSGVANIIAGKLNTIKMGNLSAFRDEGHSKDYVKAMLLMLEQDTPDDYVVATGDGATIEDMLKYVCRLAGLDFNKVYEQDARFMRPSDVPFLLGDSSKARSILGWKPEYDWKSLLKEMYENDLILANK